MDITLHPSIISGTVRAVSSKSAAHRLLFCAAFSDAATEIYCPDTNADIDATVSCLCALGASVKRIGDYFHVTPAKEIPQNATLDCGESGTTYRFLLPIVAALGIDAKLIGHGRLPSRPLSPLYETMVASGVGISEQGSNPLTVSGRLPADHYAFEGNVSSQFASGMLLGFAIASSKYDSGDNTCELTLTGKIESLPYLDLTTDILSVFGVDYHKTRNSDGSLTFSLPKDSRISTPTKAVVEGDFSSAAFWLSAGAVGKSPISVLGLSADSRQGDREIVNILQSFGASVKKTADQITIFPAKLRGIEVDASQIPDLVPIISVVAASAYGETRIINAGRLRLKESDRLKTVTDMITSLGGDITEGNDFLIIRGHGKLIGGTVCSANDHRIAMSAAIASLICETDVTILGAECTAKSYPRFFEDSQKLGMKAEVNK